MFARKLRRAIGKIRPQEDWIVLPFRDGVVKLQASDIFYIESQGHQMRYVTREGEYLLRGRMDDLEAELSPKGFFRSNRGYLVNLDQVTAVRGDCCEVGGSLLSVSRKKKAEFLKRLTEVL